MQRKSVEVKVSLASHDDALGFLELEALCFEMERNRDALYFWTPVVEYLWTYKAEIEGRLVGGMIVMPTRRGNWYINSLFVHPRFRNRGIASLMLGQFLRTVRSGLILLDVKTDRPYLLEFYEKFGFERKELLPDYYRDGTDRFLLVRKAT
jgi:ribosomal protein S18 acetylase RimI-like enzyme